MCYIVFTCIYRWGKSRERERERERERMGVTGPVYEKVDIVLT